MAYHRDITDAVVPRRTWNIERCSWLSSAKASLQMSSQPGWSMLHNFALLIIIDGLPSYSYWKDWENTNTVTISCTDIK
jgi:hypothetical protein